MTISGVAAVWLPVSDMQRAVGFYRDTLGLKIQMSEDEWSEVDANGLTLGLNARESVEAGEHGGAVVSFQPEGGIDAVVKALSEAGVEFPSQISDHPWGRIATFKDSEGNDLQLYEPPAEG